MNVEVRAVGLKAMREKRGLTQRRLAHDLNISQKYIPVIEAEAKKPGPKLQAAMIKYFGVAFEDLFEVVLVNPETGQERVLVRASWKAGHDRCPAVLAGPGRSFVVNRVALAFSPTRPAAAAQLARRFGLT